MRLGRTQVAGLRLHGGDLPLRVEGLEAGDRVRTGGRERCVQPRPELGLRGFAEALLARAARNARLLHQHRQRGSRLELAHDVHDEVDRGRGRRLAEPRLIQRVHDRKQEVLPRKRPGPRRVQMARERLAGGDRDARRFASHAGERARQRRSIVAAEEQALVSQREREHQIGRRARGCDREVELSIAGRIPDSEHHRAVAELACERGDRIESVRAGVRDQAVEVSAEQHQIGADRVRSDGARARLGVEAARCVGDEANARERLLHPLDRLRGRRAARDEQPESDDPGGENPDRHAASRGSRRRAPSDSDASPLVGRGRAR